MSGPNGDPNLSIEESIINDEDEFGDEGNMQLLLYSLLLLMSIRVMERKKAVHSTKLSSVLFSVTIPIALY